MGKDHNPSAPHLGSTGRTTAQNRSPQSHAVDGVRVEDAKDHLHYEAKEL